MKRLLFLLLLPMYSIGQMFTPAETARWEQTASRVTIIRDNWGIPHVYGKSDADAVFGLLYAQCEDDFHRVEMNYIEKLGRMAEIKGEQELYSDLLIRMVIDSNDAIADFKRSPAWLQDLMNAFADGVNYYLYKHPAVKPALLKRFQPWYPLLWTDGSIGAINTAGMNEKDLAAFYGKEAPTAFRSPKEEAPVGSNGFAFAPSVTESGKAILYINPHVTFYFRPEVHIVSEQGLNVYGAVTWGQFFIYQGFNEHCGWMHTSSSVDIADLYAEKITGRPGAWSYLYEGQAKTVKQKDITIHYKDGNTSKSKTIHALYTHHGPIMGKRKGQWLSVRANNRSLVGLVQSWQRTRANSFAAYKKTMDLLANTSNNTVYADAEGNIAYWHGNYIPQRDPKIDWARPVDGSVAATEWKGLHPVNETVHSYNPPNGWLQNCNSTPFTVAGTNSPKKSDYPTYMAPDGENFRGLNAVQVLGRQKGYTIDKVIAAGYDTYLTAFERLVPALLKAYDHGGISDSMKAALAAPIAVLRSWDFHSGENSVATTLAIEWGQKIMPLIVKSGDEDEYEYVDQVKRTDQFIATAKPAVLVGALQSTIHELTQKFGNWQIPWGDINRFQRVSSDIEQKYDDSKPSVPVGFVSSLWGMLPSYNARYFPGTKKRYGVNGNSFICAVEFGERIKAKSLLAGGESGNPASPHFKDQLEAYAKGQFKDVLFYKEDVVAHAEKTYHPGE